MKYRVVLHKKTFEKAEVFLELLMNTKPSMIFAESAVVGDGSPIATEQPDKTAAIKIIRCIARK